MQKKIYNFNIFIEEDYDQMSLKAADLLSQHLNSNPRGIYGFATGNTPIGMYKELISLYNNSKIKFNGITSFNLDEYYPMEAESVHSYHYYMMDKLFNHVDIKKENINLPDGSTKNVEQTCSEYDAKIMKSGGIDVQILGIGNNGHIGFNEPSDCFGGLTRKIALEKSTIEANSINFSSISEVPKEALTMGIRPIMMAKKIILLASGTNKAEAIHNMVFGEIKPANPASALQLHRDITVVLDKPAASILINKI